MFKVANKVFALTGLADDDLRNQRQVRPQRAVELRERYPEAIVPGWHMNKRHWNTVYVERGALDDRLVEELIDRSYAFGGGRVAAAGAGGARVGVSVAPAAPP